jgi:pimeloyl-ACP methyl ester carboxylesterase
MKLFNLIIFNLICLSVFSQSTKIGNIEFYPLGDSKPARSIFGQMEVYENNISQEGKKITLHIEVMPSKTLTNKEAPIFIVMGGPGQASSDLISFFASIFDKINKKSDLVFIDQRGTGKSNPLHILLNYNSAQDYMEDALMADSTIKNTYQALSKENDLINYVTLNAAIDIESVRVAMGYNKINIYGTSYGTRLALVYINKYANNVRTATLKGLVPKDLIMPLDFAKDSQRSLDLLINDCKNNKECSKVYPTFEKDFKALLNQSYPIDVKIINPNTKLEETVQITKESIALTFRSLLAVPTFTQQIPFMISETKKGNYKILAQLILRIKISYSRGIYTGMRLCVMCYEDYPKILRTKLDKSGKTFLGDIWTNRVMNACKIWNPPLKEAIDVEYKQQNIPVLLISGKRDSATPPKYGDEVLKYFPNGKHIIIDAGHSFDRMLNCVEHIINDFVISGSNSQLNLGCINTIKFPDFKLN